MGRTTACSATCMVRYTQGHTCLCGQSFECYQTLPVYLVGDDLFQQWSTCPGHDIGHFTAFAPFQCPFVIVRELGRRSPRLLVAFPRQELPRLYAWKHRSPMHERLNTFHHLEQRTSITAHSVAALISLSLRLSSQTRYDCTRFNLFVSAVF